MNILYTERDYQFRYRCMNRLKNLLILMFVFITSFLFNILNIYHVSLHVYMKRIKNSVLFTIPG